MAFTNYFQTLFTSAGPQGMDRCLDSITPRVSPAMNFILLNEYTEDEVDKALAQMQPLKAPGPDGYVVCFYQKHWSIIGQEVQQTILNFLNHGIFDLLINYTYITLIPKNSNAAKISDYRPIRLCNVLYKLIAKILANRLKQVLPSGKVNNIQYSCGI